MKLNKVLFLSLVSIASLAACGTKTSSTASTEAPESSIPSSIPSSTSAAPSTSQGPSAPDNTDIVIPNKESEIDIKEEAVFGNELLLNHRYISVTVNNRDGNDISQNVRGLARALSPANNLAFKIKDENIAAVDEQGNVSGVAQGETILEVTDKDRPNLKQEIPVYVFENVRERVAKPVFTALSAVDELTLKEAVDHELYEKRIYKNGSLHMYSAWDQNTVASYDEAYFRIYETDGEVKTDNGAISFKDYEWIFHNNEYYDTNLYHDIAGVKTHFPISTTSYMGQPRVTPILEILDNMFSGGRDFFINTVNNAKLDGVIEYATANYNNVFRSAWGVFYDEEESAIKDTVFFNCKITFDDPADQEDEERYGIPYGTKMKTIYNLYFTVRNNQLLGFYNHATTTYAFDGDEYEEVLDIDHTFERITENNRDKFIFIPNAEQDKGYNEVDNLFDLQKKERIIKAKFIF